MACSACSKRKQAVRRPTTTTSGSTNTAAAKAEPLRAKVRYTGR